MSLRQIGNNDMGSGGALENGLRLTPLALHIKYSAGKLKSACDGQPIQGIRYGPYGT